MKICIVLSSFIGGAPESILQYAKILIRNNHNVHVCGTRGATKCVNEFLRIGATVDTAKYGFNSPFLKRLVAIYSIAQKVVKWKPDYIISVGLPMGYYFSGIANMLNIPILCVVPGGNLTGGAKKIKKLKCDRIIVFSQENEKQLLSFGFQGKIHLIQNRINVQQSADYVSFYSQNNKEWSLFMASRLDREKLNSIKTVIDLTCLAIQSGYNARLTIAGDGKNKSEIIDYICLKGCSHAVQLVGYIDCLYDYYRNSKICFGKGRSIIEPMIIGRYTVCVSEENSFSIVTPRSFFSLMYHNFSGRNITQKSSEKDFCDLLNKMDTENNLDDLVQTQQIAVQEYGANLLERKFYKDIFSVFIKEHSNNKIKKSYGLFLFISIIKSFLLSR